MPDAATWLVLSAASAVGAVARYGVDVAVGVWLGRRNGDRTLPWGIAVVNLSGCLLVGVLAGVAGEAALDAGHEAWAHEAWVLVAQVGLLGSYTTFSTWAVDVVRLLSRNRPLAAGVNALGSLLGGGGLTIVGLALGVTLVR